MVRPVVIHDEKYEEAAGAYNEIRLKCRRCFWLSIPEVMLAKRFTTNEANNLSLQQRVRRIAARQLATSLSATPTSVTGRSIPLQVEAAKTDDTNISPLLHVSDRKRQSNNELLPGKNILG